MPPPKEPDSLDQALSIIDSILVELDKGTRDAPLADARTASTSKAASSAAEHVAAPAGHVPDAPSSGGKAAKKDKKKKSKGEGGSTASGAADAQPAAELSAVQQMDLRVRLLTQLQVAKREYMCM